MNGQFGPLDFDADARRGAPAAGGGNLMPVYLGDYLCPLEYLPSCCLKLGDEYYAFNALARDKAVSRGNDIGIIRRFVNHESAGSGDTSVNAEVGLRDRENHAVRYAHLGHANSCAYDPATGLVWIAPMFDTSTPGKEESAGYFYVYDLNNLISAEETFVTDSGTITARVLQPMKVNTYRENGSSSVFTASGISYDPVTGRLYYKTWNHHVFYRKNNTWIWLGKINLSDIRVDPRLNGTRGFGQDFAVCGDRFCLSSEYGVIASGPLSTLRPDTGWAAVNLDSTARFYQGEIEGFEFTADRHLVGLTICGLNSEVTDAFVVEFPVGQTVPYAPMLGSGLHTYHNGMLLLSEETQRKFALGAFDLRSLSQMEIRFLRSNTSVVLIPSGHTVVDDYDIRTNDCIQLLINGTYQVRSLAVFAGYLNLQAGMEGAALILTTDGDPISVRRASRLAITGDHRLNVSIPNRPDGRGFISIGYDYPSIIVRLRPNCVQGYTLQVASTAIADEYYFMGSFPLNPAAPKWIPRTYDRNAYVGAADFTKNCSFWCTGLHAGYLNFNLPLKTQLPADGSEVIIGHFGVEMDTETVMNVPSSKGGPALKVRIAASGHVVLSMTGMALGTADDPDWYRATIPATPKNGWWNL